MKAWEFENDRILDNWLHRLRDCCIIFWWRGNDLVLFNTSGICIIFHDNWRIKKPPAKEAKTQQRFARLRSMSG